MISNPKNDFERLFGPYQDGYCFEIENCQIRRALNNRVSKHGAGLKSAEFLLYKAKSNKQIIYIVEARTNAPKQLDSYISEIQEKFVDSLSLFIAMHLNRQSQAELPEIIIQANIATLDFKMVLAIEKYPDDLLSDLQDKLRKALIKTTCIWNIGFDSVIVINEKSARRHGLMNS